MWSVQQGPIIAEALLASPHARALAFKPVVLSRAVSLEDLRQAAGSEDDPQFLQDLRTLNGDFLVEDGPDLNSTHRLLLLPYARCQGAACHRFCSATSAPPKARAAPPSSTLKASSSA